MGEYQTPPTAIPVAVTSIKKQTGGSYGKLWIVKHLRVLSDVIMLISRSYNTDLGLYNVHSWLANFSNPVASELRFIEAKAGDRPK